MGAISSPFTDIFDIIGYAKEKSRIPFISLYTNGTVVDREMAEGLKKAGLDAILVTLVSQREDVHDEFTGMPGSWQKTVKGIRELVSAGIETYSFTTVHSHNIDDCREIFRFVRENLGAHSLFYQYIPQQANDPLMIPAAGWQVEQRAIALGQQVVQHDDLSFGKYHGQLTY